MRPVHTMSRAVTAVRQLLSSGPFRFAIVRYGFALLLGLVVTLLIVAAQGVSPAQFASIIGQSTFGSPQAMLNTIRWATPVMLAALAYLVAARAGIFNLGVEGQAYFGGLVAAILATTLPLPGPLQLIVAALAGVLAGALYALPAALLYRYWGVNEIVVTLMLNYIAVLVTTLIVRTWFLTYTNGVVSETIATARIEADARIPALATGSSATWAILLVVILCVITGLVLLRSWAGANLDTVGRSPGFAAFAGIDSARTQFRAFLASGALGGLVGAIEVLGSQGRFIKGFAGSFAFDGILAAIIGGLNPFGVVASSLFYGALTNTSFTLSSMTNVTSYLVMLIVAVFVILFTIDPLRAILARRRAARSKGVDE